MAHQIVEKGMKALYWKILEAEPPYTHNLWRLIKDMELILPDESGFSDLIDELQPLHIQARYPQERERLSALLSRDHCESMLERVERLVEWIRAKL